MGEIRACFRSDGMLDSLRQRLIRWVIAGSRASRQVLSNLVGIKSRGQVESDMDIMIALTSVSVVGVKLDKSGGGDGGSMCGEMPSGCKAPASLLTLSVKKVKKDVGRLPGEQVEGRGDEEER